jgi:transcriptional regulator with XRE-family HTH domain
VAFITLRQARKKKRLTQQKLAAKSGVNQRAISKIEVGKVQDPHNRTVAALEDALGLKRGSLVFGDEASA